MLAIEEEQDLVYREPGAANVVSLPRPAPAVAQWSRDMRPDTVLLFRYSALTFNSHRIHYDRDYATREEGYASLVVQGPLTATLLLDLLYRELPGVEVAAFEFRALRPLLEGVPLQLQGRQDEQGGPFVGTGCLGCTWRWRRRRVWELVENAAPQLSHFQTTGLRFSIH